MFFGERLKTVREDKGLTQSKLAELCGTSETVIRNYEKSRRTPTVGMLACLCTALDVSPNYLLQDEISAELKDKDEKLIYMATSLSPEQKEFLTDLIETMKKHEKEN